MSKPQVRRRQQIREARLEIVAQLYRRGYSYSKIRTEVMARLSLPTYSKSSVHSDVQYLLKEWREERITDTAQLVQLELERIDEAVRELWGQWERSKQDHGKTTSTRKGTPKRGERGDNEIQTLSIEERKHSEEKLGDPRYIAEIRNQLTERRKILGLYAPEKKEVSGELSFASLLMESSVIAEEDDDS